MKNTLLFAALLTGCSGEYVEVYFVDAREKPGDFSIVERACNYWQLDCVEVDHSDGGVLTIVLSDFVAISDEADSCIGGIILDEDWCNPAIWTSAEMRNAINHEIGHAFGLKHDDRKKNIMFGDDPRWDLRQKQVDKVHYRAGFLNRCRED